MKPNASRVALRHLTAMRTTEPEEALWLREHLRGLARKLRGRVTKDTDTSFRVSLRHPLVKELVFTQVKWSKVLFWFVTQDGKQGWGWNAWKGDFYEPSNFILMDVLARSHNRDRDLTKGAFSYIESELKNMEMREEAREKAEAEAKAEEQARIEKAKAEEQARIEKAKAEEGLTGDGKGYFVTTVTSWENDESDTNDDDWDNPDPDTGEDESKEKVRTLSDVVKGLGSYSQSELTRNLARLTRDYDRKYNARGVYGLTRWYIEEVIIQRSDKKPFSTVEIAYIEKHIIPKARR